jgi:hypothetical protein
MNRGGRGMTERIRRSRSVSFVCRQGFKDSLSPFVLRQRGSNNIAYFMLDDVLKQVLAPATALWTRHDCSSNHYDYQRRSCVFHNTKNPSTPERALQSFRCFADGPEMVEGVPARRVDSAQD